MAGWGGRRPNAGRKSESEIAAWRRAFDRAVPAARRVAIIRRIAAIAERGENEAAAVRAAQLLWAYRYGLPSQPLGGADDLPAIKVIEVNVSRTM